MKKICLNCTFCDVAYPDMDVREVAEENDFLICSKTKQKTDNYGTCKQFEKSKSREDDIKAGC